MSLKAKLEAVIYAAEEPVTLAQLALLFAEDALAWKAEQAELRSREQATIEFAATPELSDSTQEMVDLIKVAESMGAAEQIAPISGAEAAREELSPEAEAPSPAPELEGGGAASSAAVAGQGEAPAGPSISDAELEARRLERKRDREVRDILRGALDELIAEYASDSRGIEIREIAGGFRMGTKPEIHDAVRMFVKSLKPPMKLSLPALETLAVIAYKQPVTAPEVGEIRGVDSSGVLGSLMSRKLITTAGRKQVIGRPMLYKTTKEFLLRFGLKDVNELPSMEEFEKMAAMELSDSEDEGAEENEVPQSGDLFAEGAEDEKEESDGRAPENREQDAAAVPQSTAEALSPRGDEAAAAHAPVERQDVEEVEAEG